MWSPATTQRTSFVEEAHLEHNLSHEANLRGKHLGEVLDRDVLAIKIQREPRHESNSRHLPLMTPVSAVAIMRPEPIRHGRIRIEM